MHALPRTTCGTATCGCAGCAPQETAAQTRPPAKGPTNHNNRPPQAPRAHRWAIARKIFQLERLAKQCTFYEKHEVVNPQGQVVSSRSRGVPLVWKRSVGLVPVDPENPFLDDGTAVSISTLGYVDEQGNYHRIIRYRRLPAGDGPPLVERGRRRKRSDNQGQLRELLRGNTRSVPVFIHLRDREQLPRIPSKAHTGQIWKVVGRADRFTPLRRKMIREQRRKRLGWAGPLRAWLRSVGGSAGHHATVYCNIVTARVPREHMAALLAREDVDRVRLRPTGRQVEEVVDTSYLCTNVPKRYDRTKDESQCAGGPGPWTWSGDHAFLDAHHAASGVLAYINAGYDGMIEGNANWGRMTISTRSSTERPTLTLGLRDWASTDVHHAAFQWGSANRFKYVMDDCLPDADGVPGSDGKLDPICGDTVVYKNDGTTSFLYSDSGMPYQYSDEGNHGTRCAGIAIGNLYNEADPDLTTLEARGARSGIARRVTALTAANGVSTLEMLERTYDGDLDHDDTEYDGLDVYTASCAEVSGDEYVYYSADPDPKEWKDVTCPTKDEARGLDDNSQALVWYFVNEGLVSLKAAGNNHFETIDGTAYSVVSGCPVLDGSSSAPFEGTATGSSPAVIATGALNSIGMTAEELQESTTLMEYSSGGTTPDGRVYPSLVAVGEVCGCPTTEPAADGTVSDTPLTNNYAKQGGTSATAPRLAGSALVFKHWFMENYGWAGGYAGFIQVGLLNFADGFTNSSTSSATVTREAPPYPWWGLGRFRMRLFSGLQSSGDRALHGFKVATLMTGGSETIDLCDEGARPLPSNVRHLRITARWLDVNTGEGETKAAIRMRLVSMDPGATTLEKFMLDSALTRTDTVLRLQYDRDDTQFPCPPSGHVAVCIDALNVPTDARSVFGDTGAPYEVLRKCRSIYVAWFWECYEDDSQIACGTSMPIPDDRCDRSEVDPTGTDDGDFYSFVGDSDELASERARLDRSIRDTLRIAMKMAPSCGVSPVASEGTK